LLGWLAGWLCIHTSEWHVPFVVLAMSGIDSRTEEKMGDKQEVPPLDVSKARKSSESKEQDFQVIRKHSKREIGAYAELDPVGATLWRIDNIQGKK
jgi:hypothetical protein